MFSYTINNELELRVLDLPHARDLYDLTDANRTHLRKWLPWVDETKSVNDTVAFIEANQIQYHANRGFQAGIWYQGRLAGVIGYHGYSSFHRFISIGYWLAEDYQGKGIMTQACRAMTDYAFRELDMNRVEIRCASENRKSQAVIERLGFKQEGRVRQVEWLYDHYVDLLVYGMLREEWSDELLQ
jgi:ribosomal-protein-serine acetyltransferase